MPTSQAVWWEPRGADPENKFCEFNYSAQMWSRLLCIQGNWARLPGGGSRQTGQTDQTSWDAIQRGCLNLKNWGNKMSCSWPELYRIYSSAPPSPVYSGYISSVLVTTLPFVLPMRAFVTLLAHWSSGNLKKKYPPIRGDWKSPWHSLSAHRVLLVVRFIRHSFNSAVTHENVRAIAPDWYDKAAPLSPTKSCEQEGIVGRRADSLWRVWEVNYPAFSRGLCISAAVDFQEIWC